MKFVSVIIPNYNHASYLKDRIDSVLNQTYEHFEVIILDDCSTDNSKEVIDLYQNHLKVSHLEYNTVNSGSTFIQWKKGIELAKGEWIWIAESDDLAEPTFLASLMKYAEEPDVSLIFCKSKVIDESGNTSSYLNMDAFPNDAYYKDHKHQSSLLNSREFVLNHMYNFNQIVNASSVIFKKESAPYESKELLDFKLCGDWYFWIRCMCKGNIYYVDEALNSFRAHANTVRNKSELRMFTYFENAKIIKLITEVFDPNRAQKSKYLDYLLYIYLNRYDKKTRKGTHWKFHRSILPLGIGKFIYSIIYRLKHND